MSSNLVALFQEARLPLEMRGEPINASNREIFQMDIQRGRAGEYFRLWRGHADNLIEIPSVDRVLRQLVMMIREPRRRFEERIARRGRPLKALESQARQARAQLVRATETEAVFERWTDERLRRYLCGMDEMHLFIAGFARGTSVRDAHAALKPRTVIEAERAVPGAIVRQGEWFFVPVTREEMNLLAASQWTVRRHAALGVGGHPHVAGEVIRMRHADAEVAFARGAVRHPEHRTITLADWHRVVRNAEVIERGVRDGIYWVD